MDNTFGNKTNLQYNPQDGEFARFNNNATPYYISAHIVIKQFYFVYLRIYFVSIFNASILQVLNIFQKYKFGKENYNSRTFKN